MMNIPICGKVNFMFQTTNIHLPDSVWPRRFGMMKGWRVALRRDGWGQVHQAACTQWISQIIHQKPQHHGVGGLSSLNQKRLADAQRKTKGIDIETHLHYPGMNVRSDLLFILQHIFKLWGGPNSPFRNILISSLENFHGLEVMHASEEHSERLWWVGWCENPDTSYPESWSILIWLWTPTKCCFQRNIVPQLLDGRETRFVARNGSRLNGEYMGNVETPGSLAPSQPLDRQTSCCCIRQCVSGLTAATATMIHFGVRTWLSIGCCLKDSSSCVHAQKIIRQKPYEPMIYEYKCVYVHVWICI